MKKINILVPSLLLILASCGGTEQPSVKSSNSVTTPPAGADAIAGDNNSETSSSVTLDNKDVLDIQAPPTGNEEKATEKTKDSKDIVIEKKETAPAAPHFLAQVSCAEYKGVEHAGKIVKTVSNFEIVYVGCDSSDKEFDLLAKKLNGLLYNAENMLALQKPISSYKNPNIKFSPTVPLKTKKSFYRINDPKASAFQTYAGVYTTIRIYDDFNQKLFDCPIKKLTDEGAAKKCVEVK